MKEELEKIEKLALEEISKVNDLKELTDLKVKYLGKKGELTAILRGMGNLSPEERPIIGSIVNTVRDNIESKIAEKEEKFRRNC